MGCRSIADDFLEDKAVLQGEQWRYTEFGHDITIQRSIAISLKRIADMMEKDRTSE